VTSYRSRPARSRVRMAHSDSTQGAPSREGRSETNEHPTSCVRMRKVEAHAAIDPRLSPVIDRLVELLLADLLRRRSKRA